MNNKFCSNTNRYNYKKKLITTYQKKKIITTYQKKKLILIDAN